MLPRHLERSFSEAEVLNLLSPGRLTKLYSLSRPIDRNGSDDQRQFSLDRDH
jgi:hypothetical protein